MLKLMVWARRSCILLSSLVFFSTMASSSPKISSPPIPNKSNQLANYRVDIFRDEIWLHADQTYHREITIQKTLLTSQGVANNQQETFTFFPDKSTLHLESAEVIQPNGEKIAVDAQHVFTRPSEASQEAPGFTNSLTTTVVFSRINPGSKIAVKWDFNQLKKEPLGFHALLLPDFSAAVNTQEMIIHYPANMVVHWESAGPVVVHTQMRGVGAAEQEKIISAVLHDLPAHAQENGMVSMVDVSPFFSVTTQANWQEYGKTIWNTIKDKIQVTPTVQKLANELVGKQTEEAAAKLLYDWVVHHIHYVAVYTNEASEVMPHDPDSILKNGYGDCKDYSVLLISLLKAVGIDANPVVVQWGLGYKLFKLPNYMAFNHMIIYLPKLHVFLNPTDRLTPFGIMDPMLSHKFVLVLGDSIILSQTPKIDPNKNVYRSQNHLLLDQEGTLHGTNIQFFSGFWSIQARHTILDSINTQQLVQDILARTAEGGFGSLNTTIATDLDHPFAIRAQWLSPFAANWQQLTFLPTPTGIQLFNPLLLRKYITPGRREFPIVVGGGRNELSYVIDLPTHVQVVLKPNAVDLKNKAGFYHSEYQVIGASIHMQRTLQFNNNVFSAEDYPAVRALLYAAINDARGVFLLKS